jgi:glycosyltransferase involved in cell wall biosynthesis
VVRGSPPCGKAAGFPNLNFMKSIVIIGTTYPFRGGLAAYNERLARELISMGHQVILYTFSLQYPSFLFPGKSQYSEQPAPAGLDIRVRINSLSPWSWIRTGKEIRKLAPDLVIIKYWLPFMGPCFGTILRILKFRRRTRVVSILDNVIPHEKRPGDASFTRYFFGAVDAFVAMSRDVLKDLGKFTGKPAVLVPHPIYDSYGPVVSRQVARELLKLDPGAKYVLFFGFIRAYKGLDLLLEAMLQPQLSGIRLIVAGEYYEDRKRYEAMLSDPRFGDRLSLHTDFIADDQVKYFFCASDVVVQPYRSATQSGISQIACYFEKPMIVTAVGGLSEIVKDGVNGFVCQPKAGDLAAKILRYFKEGKEDAFSRQVKNDKVTFSWDHMAAEILRLADAPATGKVNRAPG